MLLYVARLTILLYNSPFNENTTIHLSVFLLMDLWIISSLSILVQVCMYNFDKSKKNQKGTTWRYALV